ncbi:MAG TPA: hypothetical protein VGO52_10105 [Hyphomonadaceae bacterium]|jgi:hypothetical protein|nr:hypothetical protein [Hyphomonadaceae bacterium]
MSASFLLFAVTWGNLSPEAALDRALDAVEPPPALRAAFRATLASGNAVRRIEYDPYAASGDQFKVTMEYGADEELDAVVDSWKHERQADVRIFADDLRVSLSDARVAAYGDALSIDFKHQISPNDGAVDAELSAHMKGRLVLDPSNGYLSKIQYSIDKPVKLKDGPTLTQYNQTYDFAYSERWGVSYVSAYEVEARGGAWGVAQTRTIRVTLTDVAFGLAGDAKQELASKGPVYPAGFTARLN